MPKKGTSSKNSNNMPDGNLINLDLKLFYHTVNSISDGISMTDIKGNFIFVNDTFLKLYGYTREEIIGKSSGIVRSDKNDPKVIKNILPETIKGGWSGRIITKKKDGTEIFINLQTAPIRNEKEDLLALVGVTKDLTQEIKAQEAIDEARSKYTDLFRELKDAVYESTPEGHLIELNPSGMQMFGFKSKEEMLNAKIAEELYVNQEDRKRFMEILEREGYVKNFEIEIRKKYGINAIILETSMAVKDKEGRVKAYRGILRDITEEKKQEIQLRQFVEKLAMLNEQLRFSEEELKKMNASKDKFFSIIAHDLRSPFSSLLGFSEFLEEDINDLTSEEISTFAGKINESARNVYNLLENLLQWSRIQTGRMNFEPVMFNIANRLKQNVSILGDNFHNKDIKLINEVDSSAMVFADENMVNSVLQNLMSNAIKFTKPGGSITVASKENDEFVEISVKDTGIGINSEDVKKLFRIDVHHTTAGTNDERGTGLGLVLCNELISKNGGKMWVESTFGEGSTFYFTLRKQPK